MNGSCSPVNASTSPSGPTTQPCPPYAPLPSARFDESPNAPASTAATRPPAIHISSVAALRESRRDQYMHPLLTIDSGFFHRPQLRADQKANACIANLRWGELRDCAVVPRRFPRTLLIRQKGLGMSGSAAGCGLPDEACVVALVAEVDGARTEHGRRAELGEARFPGIVRLDGGF